MSLDTREQAGPAALTPADGRSRDPGTASEIPDRNAVVGPARVHEPALRPDAAGAASPCWDRLRGAVAAHAYSLHPPLPPGPGVCAACRGPARADYLHCFHCGLHAESAPGLLADVVVPVAYAMKGGELAHNLWVYKSALAGAGPAQAALLALLLVFLRDHGSCVWRLAGGGAPTHLAVVPSTRGRPGPHPLRVLAAPVLALPWVHLAIRAHQDPPDPDDRYLSLDSLRCASAITASTGTAA